MPDIVKEALNGATTTTSEAKQSTHSGKLSSFTIGKNREELHAEEEPSVEQEENVALPSPWTKWQKLKSHFRRFRIFYIVALLIFLAIFLPISFLFIIPRIAQDLLDGGSIVINSASLLQPTSDSIVLSLNASIYVPGPFTVHTAPGDLQLYLPPVGSQYPVGTLHLPGETIRGNTSIVIEEQYLPFENYSSWQTFIHNAIMFDSGPLGLKGPIFTQLGRIKGFTLQLDKWSISKGFKQFEGFSIDSVQLILPAERDGTNLIATATLPNPSILTLEVGNATANISFGDIVIGTGMINNIFVRPGNNTVQIRGVANLTTILDNLKTILAQQSQYIQSGRLSLTTTITDISYNGSTIPYYTEEMGKVPLTAQTSILGILLNSLQGSNITGLISSLEGSNNREISLRDALHNSTELEPLARRHLNDLIKL